MSIHEFHAALNGDQNSEVPAIPRFNDRESLMQAGGDALGDWTIWSET